MGRRCHRRRRCRRRRAAALLTVLLPRQRARRTTARQVVAAAAMPTSWQRRRSWAACLPWRRPQQAVAAGGGTAAACVACWCAVPLLARRVARTATGLSWRSAPPSCRACRPATHWVAGQLVLTTRLAVRAARVLAGCWETCGHPCAHRAAAAAAMLRGGKDLARRLLPAQGLPAASKSQWSPRCWVRRPPRSQTSGWRWMRRL